ncbi:MAG: hypothetical protein AB7U73_08465, partial [Pirellulales bacterium]
IMQSPIVVLFRAVVMLFSLIAVPAIALFWNQIPDAVDRLWLTIEKHRSGAVAQADPMDPSWAEPAAPGDARPQLQEAPRYEPMGAAPPMVEPPTVSAPHGGAEQMAASSAIPGASHPAANRGVPSEVRTADAVSHAAAPNPVRPAGYNEPVVRGQAPGSIEEPMPAPATDQFTAMQYRLRQLGATYYLLENWGSDGSLYRFHCKMAIAGNSRYTRHFEATDRTPLQAIGRVLRDVEAWRAGRAP